MNQFITRINFGIIDHIGIGGAIALTCGGWATTSSSRLFVDFPAGGFDIRIGGITEAEKDFTNYIIYYIHFILKTIFLNIKFFTLNTTFDNTS